ncbi:MAG: SUKH-3 domain-containing protein, partial [Pseudomonadales bacterium]
MDFGSEKVNELLQQAGWTPDYYVDTSEYKRCLEEAGFTVFPNVLNFLKRFGDIKVSGTDPSSETKYEWFAVDP